MTSDSTALAATAPAAGGPAAPRPAARFPGPAGTPGDGAVRMRWSGEDDTLRDLVRDHVTAVGALLVDAGAAAPGNAAGADGTGGVGSVLCEIVEARTLLAARAVPAGRAVPLIVVAPGGGAPDVPAAVWEAAVAARARAVLTLPGDSDRLLAELSALGRRQGAALVVGVAGGCGGAGASSLAARLAGAAHAHDPDQAVTLLDADPIGGGLELLVEAPHPVGVTTWATAAGLGVEDGHALREALPLVDGVRLLAAGEGSPPGPAVVDGVLAALRPLGGTVVVDLGAGLAAEAAPQLDVLLLVVPAHDHAVRAAERRLARWDLPAELVELAVRRQGPLLPTEVARDLGLPLATAFRDSPAGAVPLLDVRRRGADMACRALLRTWAGGEAR